MPGSTEQVRPLTSSSIMRVRYLEQVNDQRITHRPAPHCEVPPPRGEHGDPLFTGKAYRPVRLSSIVRGGDHAHRP